MKVRVLGCSGAIAKDCRTTSFLIDSDILIDAGTGVGDLTLDEMVRIDHVFLTHAHLDHVAALPLMVDAVAARRQAPLKIHALAGTIRGRWKLTFSTTSSGPISAVSHRRKHRSSPSTRWTLARHFIFKASRLKRYPPCTPCLRRATPSRQVKVAGFLPVTPSETRPSGGA